MFTTVDIYVDGERFLVTVGTYESHEGPRRGLHINGPIDIQVDKHSINALDIYVPRLSAQLNVKAELKEKG